MIAEKVCVSKVFLACNLSEFARVAFLRLNPQGVLKHKVSCAGGANESRQTKNEQRIDRRFSALEIHPSGQSIAPTRAPSSSTHEGSLHYCEKGAKFLDLFE